MKDKSININIHNTNILKKDKKRKRKRRTNTKKYNKKEGVSLGHPTQYKNQPVVTSYPMPSFIGPQMPYNHEAMKHAEDYISPKTPRTQLLLTNGEPETNKDRNNLLLGDSTTSTTSTSTKSPLKIKILSPVKKPKSAPVQYTYQGLMKVRTLKELKALMKAAMPDIEDSLLNKITNKNKAIAIKQFLKAYDDESTPPASPPPTPPASPPPTRKSPTPTKFTTQAATTSPSAATTPQPITPTTKFTAQTPTTTDDDDSDHPIRSLHRLDSLDSFKSNVPSKLFENPKTYQKNSEFFDRHKVSKTPGTTTLKKVQITTPSEKAERPFDNDSDNTLYHELIKDHKDRETRNVIKQLIGSSIGSPAPPIGSPSKSSRGIFY